MTAYQHNYADLGEVRVHYLTAGQGPPVVLLHGIPETSYAWRHLIPYLTARYSVIAPDLRGLGDSSRPPGGYDKKTIASDIWKLVHDHLKIDTFFPVGHDWGGPVAFSIAAQHPEAVRRLVILDMVIPGDGGDTSEGGRRWHHTLFQTLDLPEALSVGRENLFINWFFDNYGANPTCVSEEARKEYHRTYSKPGALRAMFEYYRAMSTDAADTRAVLANGKLKMPVLALGGDQSFGRRLTTMESLKRVAENVRGGVVPNSGHWVAEEAPEFVATELLKFFDEEPRDK